MVGPGFTTAPNILPGFPDNINSPVDASIFNGRSLREINFSQAHMLIGDYPAYDFFQDGSFYLLGQLSRPRSQVLPILSWILHEN